MNKKPKVLVISRDSWNDTNNSGNTLSNMFQNWNADSIANLYCRDEIPSNPICKNYFKISESLLVKKLLRKIETAGYSFKIEELENQKKHTNEVKNEQTEKNLYNFFRKYRWHFFLWLRELLWIIVNWKSKKLDNFLSEFNPDVIFTTSYDSFYTHKLVYYAKKKTNAKLVVFHCDDLVTFRQHSFSPLFWLNRIMLRLYMNKTVRLSDLNYCIIEEQARVYSEIYNSEFKLLYKTGSFEKEPILSEVHQPVKIVYTGNIIYGRINTLIQFADILKKINNSVTKAELYIYTANEMDEQDKIKLLSSNSVHLMGKVAYDQIPLILSDSDVLLHVESFDTHLMKATALSFSTKIVDYLEAGKTILAIGWEKSASIKYIKENNIGFTANKTQEIENVLHEILSNPEKLSQIGNKAWKFAQKKHNKEIVLRNFEEEINLLNRK